jgi:two-component system cell cycle sensor histidine kinase/response regulator CckA
LPRTERSASAPRDSLRVRGRAAVDKTVLVVEDDDQVRRVVCRVLRAEGYCVIETRHVAEASGVIDDLGRTVHLVLTDVVMPGGDGVTFADHVETARAHLPVLLMSGYTDKVAALEGRRRLLAKPFTPNELSKAVREALAA